ncbi:MAG: response regulator [Candidatus Omnitrophota bacterium]
MENKVLVVDDERIVCRAAQKILEMEGYEVGLAATGEEALALAKKNKFKMALVDLILPGIDGVEVCKQLKTENADMKIVLMSGYLSKLKERRVVFDSLGGCLEIMEKPFGGEDIVRITTDFFERGHGC